MAIAVDATANGVNIINQIVGGTTTVSFTTGSGSNRALIASISTWNNGGTGTGCSAVLYGLQSMTLVTGSGISNGAFYTEQWQLVAPGTGTANIVATVVGKTDKLGLGAISFTGVDQTNPIDTNNAFSGTSGTVTGSLTLSDVNEYMVDAMSHLSANTSSSHTDTLIYENATAGTDTASQYGVKSSSGSQSMSWTMPDPGDTWAYSVLALKAAASAPAASGAPVQMRIPNRNVGPMALRHNFKQPYFSSASIYIFAASVTQAAVARIANTITKTQSATARISNTTTKTQSSVARIANVLTKTQASTARVAVNLTRTQSSTARITQAGTVTKTQMSIARIANNLTKTQSAVARIAINSTKTQSSVARVANSLTKTQNSVARIANSPTKTQTSTARIQKTVTKTQTSTARIANNTTKTQTSTARVANNLTKTQLSVARISKILTKTQTSTARIAVVQTKTQSSTARIVQGSNKTQTSIARIANNLSKTQNATARIAKVLTITQSAVARIARTVTKTQSATAHIVNVTTFTKTQTSTARIAVVISKTQSATARIIQTPHYVSITEIVSSTSTTLIDSSETNIADVNTGGTIVTVESLTNQGQIDR